MVRRIAAAVLVVGCVAAAAGWWYYRSGRFARSAQPAGVVNEINWLDHIYSQNPAVAEEARRQLKNQHTSAIPAISETLRNPTADEDHKKAALRGCAVLGADAAGLIDEVAAHLTVPALTVEAGVALSFMGEEAFVPLRDALASEDPIVRKEALRAIGKLQTRASLPSGVVVPLLLDGLADADPDVRMISAIYLGIIHDEGEVVVPELIEMLQDEHAEVRTASAAALGSFGPEAEIAVPALQKAKADPDENVAREAGVSLVKLNRLP